MRDILEALGGGDVCLGGLYLSSGSLQEQFGGSKNLGKLAKEKRMVILRELTPPEYLAAKTLTNTPEHSARDLGRFFKGTFGVRVFPPHRAVSEYLASVDVGVGTELRMGSYPFPTAKDKDARVNMWSKSPVNAFIRIVLQRLQVGGGKFDDLGWDVDGKKYLIMIHNTDKGGPSTKTLMSVVLSDSQDGQSTPVRIMTYSGPDDYAHLKVMMPNIIPGIDDLEALSCVCFTLKTGDNVVTFVPKASLPAEPALPSIALKHTTVEGPIQSFYNSCEVIGNSPHALVGPFKPISFSTEGPQLSGLLWGDYVSPLSSKIATLDAIESVAYYDLLTMYGGDLKCIFDLDGRCNGSSWHCAYCTWQRGQSLNEVCAPLTPQILAEWARIGIKCCSTDTPPLHNHTRDRLVPCMLHYELGLVPYNIQAIEKLGVLLVTAGSAELQQGLVADLARLGHELAEVVLEQEETSRSWVVVATPYMKAQEELEEQERLQKAAPPSQQSNYDKAIGLLKNKLRRPEAEVNALRKRQSDQTAKVLELKREIEVVRKAMNPEVLATCDWLRLLMKQAMDAVGSEPQVYFGGTAFVGNDCKKTLGEFEKFLNILQNGFIEKAKQMFKGPALGLWIQSINEKFSLWRPLFGILDCFFSIANSSKRFTDQQLSQMDECVPIIKGLWVRLYGDLNSAPPKIHGLVDHVMEFAKKYRFFVHGGEQIGEKEHAKDNRHSRQLQSLKKQYAKIEKGKEKLRVQEADPGQLEAARVAWENTKRKKNEGGGGKKSKKEERDTAKKQVKHEVRTGAVEAGRAALAPPPAPPPHADSVNNMAN